MKNLNSVSLLKSFFILGFLVLSTLACQKNDYVAENIQTFNPKQFPSFLSEQEMDQLLMTKFEDISSLTPKQRIEETVKILNDLFSSERIEARTDDYHLQAYVYVSGHGSLLDNTYQTGLPSTYVQASVTRYPSNGSHVVSIAQIFKNGLEIGYDIRDTTITCPEGEFVRALARPRLWSDGSIKTTVSVICKD